MKKIITILSFVLIIILISCTFSVNAEASIQKSISNKVIRFHVLANSDREEDQKLKLQVRDEVLKYIYPKLKNSKNIDETREILKRNDTEIKKIAERVIKKNGYSYSVTTGLKKEAFPVKTYGNITLPPGEYEAYKILIGEKRGQNWWCVMFPPLCFVDVTKGSIAYKETEKEMQQVLTKKEYSLIDNTKENKPIKVKFKIVEIINSIFK